MKEVRQISDYTEDALVCAPSPKPEVYDLVELALRQNELWEDMVRGIRILRTMLNVAGLTAGVEAADDLLRRTASMKSGSP
jgi:hypothetical protein